MKKNMGLADKVIRIVIAVIFLLSYAMGWVKGTIGIVLLVISVVFILTSFISFCPLYTLLGINTCPKDQKNC